MLDSNLAGTITVVVALSAVISPILTALINNRHHTKIKMLELQQQQYENETLHKRAVFERYLENAGRKLAWTDIDSSKSYYDAYFNALFFAPPELQKQMIKIHLNIQHMKETEANALLADLASKLNESLEGQHKR